MAVEYITTMDPQVAALLGIGIGVWAPDRYTNEIVKRIGTQLVAKKSDASSEQVRDDLVEVDRSNTEPETDSTAEKK